MLIRPLNIGTGSLACVVELMRPVSTQGKPALCAAALSTQVMVAPVSIRAHLATGGAGVSPLSAKAVICVSI